MRTVIFLCSWLFVLMGCKGKSNIPGDIIPQKKMQTILWDMMRADQFLADYVLNRDTTLKKETESLKYYQQIFTIHKVSKEEFEHSFAFYNARPALFQALMDSINAPPAATIVTNTEQIATPVAIPDSTVQAPVNNATRDTAVLRRKRPAMAE